MADQKPSRFLSEEKKDEIIRLAKMGYPQLKIRSMLQVSQYAVTRYAKGINPPKKIGEEQKAEVIMLLQDTQYTTKKIAELVGVSTRCVTRINRIEQIRPHRKAINREMQIPQRDHSLRYEVFVFNWAEHPDTVNTIVCDHVPCYWDLMKACAQIGMNAEDFETEASSSVRNRCCYGNVYDANGAVVAKYCIERIVGCASDYDEFWDGMDKNFYDS